MKNDVYIINIYHEDKGFIGYIKSYRKHRNGKYRFTKTKNIAKALKYSHFGSAINVQIKLNQLESKDKLYYNNSYFFIDAKLTEQEIRKSKLNVLKSVKIREGLFKKKI